MNRQEIIAQLSGIVEDVFDLDEFEYADTVNATDIEEWDSLSNIRFMVAVEKQFGVRFSNGEIEGLENVGALVALVENKLG